MLNAAGDPFNMVLNGRWHIAQNRGAARACDGEHIGKPGHLQAQIVTGPIAPNLFQLVAMRPWMSIFSKEPVMASKPVAKIRMSKGYTACAV